MKTEFAMAALLGVLIAGPASAGIPLVPPPAGSRVINFDDVAAPPFFVNTTALRDQYAALGVRFSAPGNDGGAILDEDSQFQVTGYSGVNFLAFNDGVFMSDGGNPVLPETLTFQHPVRRFQFNVGDAFESSTVTATAYDKDDNVVTSNFANPVNAMQTVVLEGRQIAKVVITTTGTAAIIDDVAFVLDSTIIDFDDLAGAPTGFAESVPLRDRYLSKGVSFFGANDNDGGAILDEGSLFFVNGYSSPNFLAFGTAQMSNGGLPHFPEYIIFQPLVRHVEFKIGGGLDKGATFKAEAYDFDANLLDTAEGDVGSVMSTVTFDHPGIANVKISYTGNYAVIDDLEYDVDGTVIDFDDLVGAASLFSNTTALRDRYAALGATFEGPGNDGCAILDDIGFSLEGNSGPNILAFNSLATLQDGGKPFLPETIHFDRPMKRVEFRLGSNGGNRVYAEAFNAAGQSIGTNYLDPTAKVQTMTMYDPGVTRVEITTGDVNFGGIDDLAFVPTDACAHDACYQGDPLDQNCSACVTQICADNSDCCNDSWNLACAQAVGSVCSQICLPLCGDANDDRKLTSSDALSALKTAVGTGMCVPVRCDYNGDGSIKSSDALAILKAAVGTPPTPKCPPVLL